MNLRNCRIKLAYWKQKYGINFQLKQVIYVVHFQITQLLSSLIENSSIHGAGISVEVIKSDDRKRDIVDKESQKIINLFLKNVETEFHKNGFFCW